MTLTSGCVAPDCLTSRSRSKAAAGVPLRVAATATISLSNRVHGSVYDVE